MAYKGYDFFTTLPDSKEEMECKVCGCVCHVRRKVSGPMSFGGAIAGKNTLHDEFSCPNSDENWHKQALKLYQDIEKCNSPSLKKIMQNDLNDMING